MRSYYPYTGEAITKWNRNERKEKAQKIFAVISDSAIGDVNRMYCLDVGCGSGAITEYMGQHFQCAVGIDANEELTQEAVSHTESKNTFFCVADAIQMSFGSKIFDVIIANHIYEHVTDANRLMAEIYRVLKDEGVCYFAGPNRIQLIEPHRHLPLLHWLPEKLTNRFLRALGDHRPYDANLMDYWSLRRMISRRFNIVDYTVPVLTEPDKFHVETSMRKDLLGFFPHRILTALLCFSPGVIWILKKKL